MKGEWFDRDGEDKGMRVEFAVLLTLTIFGLLGFVFG